MKKRYMINGFEEGKNYFLLLGRFTDSELEQMEDGEVLTKGENRFWIITEEV